MKRWIFLLAVIFVSYGLIELLGSIGYTIAIKGHTPTETISQRHIGIIKQLLQDTTGYIAFSKDLGWTIRESAKTKWYTANSAGIRSIREYTLSPDSGITRIMVCGDGFVHCNDVKDNEAWPALLEHKNKQWEVLNLGVWGYSLDQIYLRYLNKGVRYKSHIVLIGMGTDNMFRLVNTYRPFMFRNTALPFAKPRYLLQDDSLLLIKKPFQYRTDYEKLLDQPEYWLPILGENDYYYHELHFSKDCFSSAIKLIKMMNFEFNERRIQAIPFRGEYNENMQALDIMLKLIETFHTQVELNGALPVFCIFPLAYDIMRFKKNGHKRYTPLLSHFQAQGYKYIDGINAFNNVSEDYTVQDLYNDFYSVIGNELIASYIEQCLYRIMAARKTTTVPQFQ